MIILVAGAGMFFTLHSALRPDVYEQDHQGFHTVHWPRQEEEEDRDHPIYLSAWVTEQDREIVETRVHFVESRDGNFESRELQHVRGSRLYVAHLPKRLKGKRWFYYLEAADNRGNRVTIPPGAPGPGIPLCYVTYDKTLEGGDHILLVFHIILVMGALFFLLHGLYYSLEVLWLPAELAGKDLGYAIAKGFKNILAGWVAFFLGAGPLGYYVAMKAFGQGWSGWPVGSDITDNKSLLMILYWGAVLVYGYRVVYRKRDAERFGSVAWWVVLGSILTAVVYLIPHSVVIQ